MHCPVCNEPIASNGCGSTLPKACRSCQNTLGVVGAHDQQACEIPESGLVAEFQIVRQLGLGGHGMVFEALDTKLDRVVALKIPRFIGTTQLDQEFFLREARAMAQLTHKNIVRIHGAGRDGEIVFIINEFIDGITLDQWHAKSEVSQADAVDICIQIAQGLQHAHQAGVVHRDLKPPNVIVTESGHAYLMDFGLASLATDSGQFAGDGMIVGTPAYMSPEQAFGKAEKATAESDVYSLGVILFELLTGERPFSGSNESVLMHTRFTEPPSVSSMRPDVSRDLDTIVKKCLEKNPELRFASAQELADDLERWREGRPILCRRSSVAERTWRWARRNRILASMGAVSAASLVIGMSFSIGFANLATKSAEKVTQSREDSARQSQKQAITAINAIEELVLHSESEALWDVQDAGLVRRDLVLSATEQLDDLLLDFPDDQNVITSCADGHLKLGMIEQTLGNLQSAQNELDKAIEVASKLNDEEEKAYLHSQSLRRKSGMHVMENEIDFAKSTANESMTVMVSVEPGFDFLDEDADAPSKYRRELARSFGAVARTYRSSDVYRSIEYFERARALGMQLVTGAESNSGDIRELIHVTQNLSACYRNTDQSEKAIAVTQEVVKFAEPGFQDRHPTFQNQLAALHDRLAEILCDSEQYDSARVSIKKSVWIRKRLAKQFPSTFNYVSCLAHDFAVLARVEQGLGNMDEAAHRLSQSLRLREEIVAKFGETQCTLPGLARGHRRMGQYLRAIGNDAEAVCHFKSAIDFWANAFFEKEICPTIARNISQTYRSLAQLHSDEERFDEADRCYKNSIEICEMSAEQFPKLPMILVECGRAHELYSQFLECQNRVQVSKEHAEISSRFHQAAKAIVPVKVDDLL